MSIYKLRIRSCRREFTEKRERAEEGGKVLEALHHLYIDKTMVKRKRSMSKQRSRNGRMIHLTFMLICEAVTLDKELTLFTNLCSSCPHITLHIQTPTLPTFPLPWATYLKYIHPTYTHLPLLHYLHHE